MKLKIALFSMLLLLFASGVKAQVLYGSLTGNVTDSSGAVLPGARVEALNVATGVARESTTESAGVYRLVELPPGTYKVTISAPGFTTVVTENVRVDVNTVRRVDAQLAVAKQRQSIEVTGAPPPLQGDRADVHTDVDAQQILNLPITSSVGRNVQALYKLVPGFSLVYEGVSSEGGLPCAP